MYILAENDQPITIDELLKIVNSRALQIIWLCIISMLFCQILKFAVLSIRNKKVLWRSLYTTGGFPSSHSSICMTLVTSLFLFQLHDLGGKIDWSFAVAVIVSIIIIHDAMGVRLEASKHAIILNNMASDMPLEERKSMGFGKKGVLKELLGHKGFEVLGGIILGILIGIVGYFVLVDLV